MSAGAAEVPAGFVALPRMGDFIAANGPLYLRHAGGQVRIGFRVEPRHTNSMGMCHGGMMATFCDMLLPLDFDGRADSIYHPFDRAGNRHMEYVRQHGAFDDMPLERIVADFERTYPGWLPQSLGERSFAADVERETR